MGACVTGFGAGEGARVASATGFTEGVGLANDCAAIVGEASGDIDVDEAASSHAQRTSAATNKPRTRPNLTGEAYSVLDKSAAFIR